MRGVQDIDRVCRSPGSADSLDDGEQHDEGDEHGIPAHPREREIGERLHEGGAGPGALRAEPVHDGTERHREQEGDEGREGERDPHLLGGHPDDLGEEHRVAAEEDTGADGEERGLQTQATTRARRRQRARDSGHQGRGHRPSLVDAAARHAGFGHLAFTRLGQD